MPGSIPVAAPPPMGVCAAVLVHRQKKPGRSQLSAVELVVLVLVPLTGKGASAVLKTALTAHSPECGLPRRNPVLRPLPEESRSHIVMIQPPRGGDVVSDETIRDSSGRTIGFVRNTEQGGQQAYNVDRQTLGFYDARNNITKDVSGRLVAKGNVVAGLFFDRR
jgi:hypothetical protein